MRVLIRSRATPANAKSAHIYLPWPGQLVMMPQLPWHASFCADKRTNCCVRYDPVAVDDDLWLSAQLHLLAFVQKSFSENQKQTNFPVPPESSGTRF